MIAEKDLKLRESIRKRKPVFLRQDHHKKKRLGKKWRKPKGHHSKLRLGWGGHWKKVEIGYKMPERLKGISSGLKQKLVYSKKDLENVNAKSEGILIASSIGTKKRVELVKEAVNKKIKILNIKDPVNYIKEIEENIAKRKGEKKKEEAKKEEKVKEKKEKKVKGKEELSEEERKKKEKEEKDKVLTKRS